MGLIGGKLPANGRFRQGFANRLPAAQSAVCASRRPCQSQPVRAGRLLSLAASARGSYPSPGRSDAPNPVRPAEFFAPLPRNSARERATGNFYVVFGPTMPESLRNRHSKKGRLQCVEPPLGQFSASRSSDCRPVSTTIWNAALQVRPQAPSSPTPRAATSRPARSSAARRVCWPTTSTPTSATDPRAAGRAAIASDRRAGHPVRAAVAFLKDGH